MKRLSSNGVVRRPPQPVLGPSSETVAVATAVDDVPGRDLGSVPMGTTDDFFERVRRDAEGLPLLVERTEAGFDVRRDVVDAEWNALLHRSGLTKVFTHRVRVDEDQQSYTITDDVYTVSWKRGVELQGAVPVPVLRASKERKLGTFKEFESRKTFAISETGLDKVVDYSYSSETGRRVITTAAEQLGLTKRADTFTKIGLLFAIIGITVGLLAAIFAVIVTR